MSWIPANVSSSKAQRTLRFNQWFSSMFSKAITLAALILHIKHKHLCEQGNMLCKPMTAQAERQMRTRQRQQS